MNRHRIYYTKAEEREQLVTILTRNGYTVRAGKEPKDPKAPTRGGALYVECWREA